MALTVTKQLICPQCDTVMAEASYRRFLPRLRVRTIDGVELPPESMELLLLRARDQAAEDRVTFLEDHLDEYVFDLRCRSDHSTLRTMPQIARAVRSTPGRWVDLRF